MRAGLLRYRISVVGKKTEQSASGFVKESDVDLFSCLAHIKKQYRSYDKDGLLAKEVFDGRTMLFQIRNSKLLSKAKQVKYNDDLFDIIMVEPNIDNTVVLTCRRIDK